jgi:hypothetical protein
MRRAILIVRIQANDRYNDRGMDNGQMKRGRKTLRFFTRPDYLLVSTPAERKQFIMPSCIYIQVTVCFRRTGVLFSEPV